MPAPRWVYTRRVATVSPLVQLSKPSPVAPVALATNELRALIERGATTEGTHESSFPGLCFHRISRPSHFRKWNAFGPSLTLVAQGQKFSSYRGVKLVYDPSRYLVVTGEAEFEGTVTEASPQRPFLAICYQIPPDVVARTLLSFADVSAPAVAEESVPAYVADLEGPIADCVVRLLRAIDDPLERKIVAPLAVEELVFRLLRSDAAAAVRSAVGHDHDTAKISLAMRFLRKNLASAVSVEDVARHVAMSSSHFAHRFRAVARVSPMRYLKGLRLNHARALMISDGLRVSEAATRSGYESASHFTRDFKAVFGASPAEYVRQFRDVG